MDFSHEKFNLPGLERNHKFIATDGGYRWARWWVRTSEILRYQELLTLFVNACWDDSIKQIARYLIALANGSQYQASKIVASPLAEQIELGDQVTFVQAR